MIIDKVVSEDLTESRADKVAAVLFPQFSRTRIQDWIRRGLVTADGRKFALDDTLPAGSHLQLAVSETEWLHSGVSVREWSADEGQLKIVYQDESLSIIDKQPGLVMHPAPGNHRGTLANILLYHYPRQRLLPRVGIVHRLDKNTSGLLVVAHTLEAWSRLSDSFREHNIERQYNAVVCGRMTGGGRVDEPLRRDRRHRLRFAVATDGKPATSIYRVKEVFRSHTWVSVKLLTGRTHQVRVHMSHRGYPIVGDHLYGARPLLPRQPLAQLREVLRHFPRQALHATRLGFHHPLSGEYVQWESQLPEDIAELLELLRQDCREAAGRD